MQEEVPSSSDSNHVAPETTEGNDEGHSNIVRDFHPDDVLMGRGVARNEHSGNVRYREIVARYKEEYLATKKRVQKNRIARKVQKSVESNGGRFLRECGLSGGEQNLFVVEERSIVLEKVKQALRFLGRENKERIHQSSNHAAAPSAIPAQKLDKESQKMPSSSGGESALHQRETLTSVSLVSDTAISTPTHPIVQASLVQALLQQRSLINDVSTLKQPEHQPLSHTAPVVTATYPSTFTQGVEQSITSSQLMSASIHPERAISALLESIRRPNNFVENSHQSAMTLQHTSQPSPHHCVNINPNLLAMLLSGGAGASALHVPSLSAPSLSASNFYPSMFGGSTASTQAQIPMSMQGSYAQLPTNGVWDIGQVNATTAAGTALRAALPTMDDNQIRMILTLLNSRRNSE
jgi:hypothetical protein